MWGKQGQGGRDDASEQTEIFLDWLIGWLRE